MFREGVNKKLIKREGLPKKGGGLPDLRGAFKKEGVCF